MKTIQLKSLVFTAFIAALTIFLSHKPAHAADDKWKITIDKTDDPILKKCYPIVHWLKLDRCITPNDAKEIMLCADFCNKHFGDWPFIKAKLCRGVDIGFDPKTCRVKVEGTVIRW